MNARAFMIKCGFTVDAFKLKLSHNHTSFLTKIHLTEYVQEQYDDYKNIPVIQLKAMICGNRTNKVWIL